MLKLCYKQYVGSFGQIILKLHVGSLLVMLMLVLVGAGASSNGDVNAGARSWCAKKLEPNLCVTCQLTAVEVVHVIKIPGT